MTLAGAGDLDGAGTDPVHLEWADSHSTVTIDGGSVAAQLATLAGPSGGTGGVYAETAAVYNSLATSLAKVNLTLDVPARVDTAASRRKATL